METDKKEKNKIPIPHMRTLLLWNNLCVFVCARAHTRARTQMYMHKELGERGQAECASIIYRCGHGKLLSAKRKMQNNRACCDPTVIK